jgi:hypothetical protein
MVFSLLHTRDSKFLMKKYTVEEERKRTYTTPAIGPSKAASTLGMGHFFVMKTRKLSRR